MRREHRTALALQNSILKSISENPVDCKYHHGPVVHRPETVSQWYAGVEALEAKCHAAAEVVGAVRQIAHIQPGLGPEVVATQVD